MEAEAEAKIAKAEEKAKKAEKEAVEAEEEAPPAKPGDTKVAGVLTVTALAAQHLKEAIRGKTADPEAGFRLTRSPDKPNQLKMTLDRAKPEDRVVESEGVRILIISPELIPTLEGMVIDYQETLQGGGFSITRRPSGK